MTQTTNQRAVVIGASMAGLVAARVLTVWSVGKDYPPTDESEFLEFTRSLRHPILYDLVKNARPLSPVYAYRRTENCWRHYEKLSKLPPGVVAVGDAVCTFNPVYGQGMTTGALGAIARLFARAS
jgi:2-polyprenyl-6-methoxyphenol hydroxylase-like FAD-dependent oxidoreductase